MSQPELPGWRWGPFTFRLPFYHTRLYWPELFQGIFIAAATGLSLIPLMTMFFGLTFEEAVAASMIHSILISSALIVFGEPYAPGWLTPALPLALAFAIGAGDDPTLRLQAMTALSLDFALLLFVLGLIGRPGSRSRHKAMPTLKTRRIKKRWSATPWWLVKPNFGLPAISNIPTSKFAPNASVLMRCVSTSGSKPSKPLRIAPWHGFARLPI